MLTSYYIKVAIWWFNQNTKSRQLKLTGDLCIDVTDSDGIRHKSFDDMWEMRDWLCEQAGVPYGVLPCGAIGWNFSDIEPQYEQAVSEAAHA